VKELLRPDPSGILNVSDGRKLTRFRYKSFMAQKSSKVPQNIPGSYFVDDQCIACDACVIEAPQFFAMNDDLGFAYVKKQPQNKSDIELCESALSNCPVGSIGNDG
jgi:ferredoxin